MPRAEIQPATRRDGEIRSDQVVVQWGTGKRDVEIGTVIPASRSGASLPVDQGFRGASDDGVNGEREPFDGWFVPLDRDGINKLIRDLRRARDAAYGADS